MAITTNIQGEIYEKYLFRELRRDSKDCRIYGVSSVTIFLSCFYSLLQSSILIGPGIQFDKFLLKYYFSL